jgi:DNA-binding transcriptional LysR family regulator
MNPNTFDLNLLRVFDAVMREGNITAAGARLGLTQPAMSHALKRLREHCKDPLFVRTTRGMKPTAYAQVLAEPIAQAMAVMRTALELDVQFDPATSTRTFGLVMTDIAELIFLPLLIPHLKRVAPQVRVVSTQLPRERYRDALELGTTDLAIGQLPAMQSDFHQQYLFDEPLVCVMRRDHPTIGQRLSMRQFMETEQVVTAAPALVDGLVKRALGKRAARRKIALQVPHYLVVPMVLPPTDLIAVVPKAVATAFARFEELKALPLPFPVPAVQVRQFWHERFHHDPGHRWMRGVIAELFMQ